MATVAALRPVAPAVEGQLPAARRQLGTRATFTKKGRGRHGSVRGGVALSASSSPTGNSNSNSNYVVPLDKAMSGLTRPLAEILRDLNKRVPDNIIVVNSNNQNSIPWYHANRMLSFYAPGWCGEVRDVMFADNGSVTVVYRVTIHGSDGQAHRESTATVVSSAADRQLEDPVAAAEELAFCRACARFGFGLYLYHEEEEILQEERGREYY